MNQFREILKERLREEREIWCYIEQEVQIVDPIIPLCDPISFTQTIEQIETDVLALIDSFTGNPPIKIILVESNPFNFLSAFFAILNYPCHLFLANPHWKESEWKQIAETIHPQFVIHQGKILLFKTYLASYFSLHKEIIPDQDLDQNLPSFLIMIPTGGTSGKIKFAMHTQDTLIASVMGFKNYFNLQKINSFCILPLYHVSGLMQIIRSLITQGKVFITPYKSLVDRDIKNLPILDYENYFISLVPTQLQTILQKFPHWLKPFKTILLGGAPAWNPLLEQAKNYQLNLAPTYGMTETASQIVTLKPADFLQGKQGIGQVLPHANLTLTPEGLIKIKSRSNCLGYYPHLRRESFILTDDLGAFDKEGYLTILGRKSQKIISGGENIFPIEIETIIQETGYVKDIIITSLPDEKWGEIVLAIYSPINATITAQMIQDKIRESLSPYKQPKKWIAVEKIPRNEQGKLSIASLVDYLTIE